MARINLPINHETERHASPMKVKHGMVSMSGAPPFIPVNAQGVAMTLASP